MTGRRFVIVGASLAGAKAAETLRREGFDGEVVLIGEEAVRPYERPPLSKGYLQGTTEQEKVFVHDAGFYGANEIDLLLSRRVEKIDLENHHVVVDNGERIAFDACLIATGASPRRLDVAGSELDGVHYLRELGDSDRLRAAVATASKVVVIGAGWIGSEVAASARQLNVEVAMVEAAPVPLARVLGEELGRFYADVHARHGVEMHLGVGIDSIAGAGKVEEVHLANGERIACDTVVVGVGVAPRAELGQAAGLEVDNGIVTDEFLATSHPDVYAAGDVANMWHPTFGRRIRLEHWSSALNQGPAAARNMLGQAVPYTKVPYFFSDQYEIGMEYSGYATEWDRVIYRGDPASGQFVAFWMHEGRVAAGMNVNVWDVADHIAALVTAKTPVDPAQLVDPEVDLATLAQQADQEVAGR